MRVLNKSFLTKRQTAADLHNGEPQENIIKSEAGFQEVPNDAFIASYRIYYEDTDAGGVVYYANYLKFFERARTDLLRSKNIIQSEIAEELGIVFVVRDCHTKYLKPARMDDLIDVSVEIIEVGKVSLRMKQEISLKGKILNEMEVEIVC
ncbi:MAG: acyl-CoA thioester hydrolase, partial [Rickettsiales bacterium]